MATARVKRAKAKAVPVDGDHVRQLLQASQAAHRNAKMLRLGKNAAQAAVVLKRAADLRVEALQVDPTRRSPAWEEEQRVTAVGRDTHEDLMAFYREKGAL